MTVCTLPVLIKAVLFKVHLYLLDLAVHDLATQWNPVPFTTIVETVIAAVEAEAVVQTMVTDSVPWT